MLNLAVIRSLRPSSSASRSTASCMHVYGCTYYVDVRLRKEKKRDFDESLGELYSSVCVSVRAGCLSDWG